MYYKRKESKLSGKVLFLKTEKIVQNSAEND